MRDTSLQSRCDKAWQCIMTSKRGGLDQSRGRQEYASRALSSPRGFTQDYRCAQQLRNARPCGSRESLPRYARSGRSLGPWKKKEEMRRPWPAPCQNCQNQTGPVRPSDSPSAARGSRRWRHTPRRSQKVAAEAPRAAAVYKCRRRAPLGPPCGPCLLQQGPAAAG